jgi:type IV pilus assembly protein PilF
MRQIKWILIILLLFYLSGCNSPSLTDFDKHHATDARLKLAIAYLDSQPESRYYQQLAYQNLLLAKQYSPNSHAVLLAMARFYQQVGLFEQAEYYYQHLVQQQSKQGTFLIQYGCFLCNRGRYKEAKYYFDRAIKLNHFQWQVEAIEQYAHCLRLQDRHQEAEQQLALLLSLSSQK